MPHNPDSLYNLAWFQARLAGAASLPGSGVSADEAQAEGDRAVLMLRQAGAAGYGNLRNIRFNKNLDPIRSRPDFGMILLDLAFPADLFAP